MDKTEKQAMQGYLELNIESDESERKITVPSYDGNTKYTLDMKTGDYSMETTKTPPMPIEKRNLAMEYFGNGKIASKPEKSSAEMPQNKNSGQFEYVYNGNNEANASMIKDLFFECCYKTRGEYENYIKKSLSKYYDVRREGKVFVIDEKKDAKTETDYMDHLNELVDFIDQENPTPYEVEKWYEKKKSESKISELPEKTKQICADYMLDAINEFKKENDQQIKADLKGIAAYYAEILGYDLKKVLGEK